MTVSRYAAGTLIGDTAQFATKTGQSFDLSLDCGKLLARNPVRIGTRAIGPIVELQQCPHVVNREAKRSGVPDKAKTA
jgi:hypothetical protein